MIRFLDFEPRQISPPGFLKAGEYESMQDVMRDLNDWVARDQINVISIETVVLPNMNDTGESGTTDVSLRTSGEFSTSWHQFVRVWYRS